MKTSTARAAAFLLLLAAAPVQAQLIPDQEWGFSLGLLRGPGFGPAAGIQGATQPLKKEGYYVQLAADRWIRDELAIGLEWGVTVDQHPVGGTIKRDVDGDGNPEFLMYRFHSQYMHVTPTLKLSRLWEDDALATRLYWILGAGWYHHDISQGSAKILGFKTSAGKTDHGDYFPIPGRTVDAFGFNAGAGVSFKPGSKKWVYGLDLRYHRINMDFSQALFDPEFFMPTLRVARAF